MKRTIIGLILLLILIVIGGAWAMRSHQSPPDRVVKVGYFQGNMASTPILVADAKGFFAKEGIRVEKVLLASSNQAMDALARGDVDVTAVSMLPVLAAQTVDPDKVKVFSLTALTNEAPFDMVVTKQDGSIQTLADLAGKKIGVYPGTSATNFLREYLKRQNIDVSKIEFVQLPPQNQLAALESGSVVALHMYEPGLTVAREKSALRPLTQSVYATTFSETPIATHGISVKFLQENPALADKAVRAVEQAIAFMNTDDAGTRTVVAKEFNIDPAIVAKMSMLKYKTFDEEPAGFLDSFISLVLTLGELKTKPDISRMIYRHPS